MWIKLSLPNGKQAYTYTVALAAVCWAIWRTRNAVFFFLEKKRVKSPIEICMMRSFIAYWSGLPFTAAQYGISDGARCGCVESLI